MLHSGQESECMIKFNESTASPDVRQPWDDVFHPEESGEPQSVTRGSQN